MFHSRPLAPAYRPSRDPFADSPNRDALVPPHDWVRPIVAVGRWIAAPLRWTWRYIRTRRELARLSDHLLADIGVQRRDIPRIARHGAGRPDPQPRPSGTLARIRLADMPPPAGPAPRPQ